MDVNEHERLSNITLIHKLNMKKYPTLHLDTKSSKSKELLVLFYI